MLAEQRHRRGEPPIRRSDAILKVFSKPEKLLEDKLRKAPRNISPRQPIYNMALGRYIKHLEKPLFKMLGEVAGHRVVFKGVNALE